jgi:hypothetical protein
MGILVERKAGAFGYKLENHIFILLFAILKINSSNNRMCRNTYLIKVNEKTLK